MHRLIRRVLSLVLTLSALFSSPGDLLAKVEMVPQIGHSNYVNTLDSDPSGHLVATGGDDAKINFWDVRSGALLRSVNDGGGNVWSMSFSTDGQALVSAHADGKVRVWAAQTGKLLRILDTHQGGAQFVKVLDDGRVVTAGRDGARLHGSIQGGAATILSKEKATTASVSGDQKTLATISDDTGITLIDLAAKKVKKTIPLSGYTVVALDQNATYALVTALFTGAVELINLSDGSTKKLQQVKGMPFYVDFLPDGKNYLLGGFGVPLEKAPLLGGPGKFIGDAMSARIKAGQGRLLLAGFGGFTVRVLDLESQRELQSFRGFKTAVSGAQFSTAGDKLLTTTSDGLVAWDLISLRPTTKIQVEGGRLALTRDAKRAIVARTGITLVDIAHSTTRALVVPPPPRPDGMPHMTVYDAVALSGDGSQAATAGSKPGLELWDTKSGKVRWKNEMTGVLDLRFDPTGKHLFVLASGFCEVLKVTDGTSVKTIPLGDAGARVGAIDEETKRAVVSVYGKNQVAVFNLESGQVDKTYDVPVEAWELALSPKGDRALLVDRGQDAVREIDLGTGAVERVAPAAGLMRGLAYSRDSKLRVVAGNEGVIQLDHLGSKQTVRLVASGDDWIVYTLDGLFDASPTGAWLVSAVEGERAFRIDQIAHKNNRPDLILSRFGTGTKPLIDYLHGRYQRRLARLGISEAALSSDLSLIPEVEIQSEKQSGGTVTLDVLAKSRAAELAYFNVYVNDVPIQPAPGLPTSGHRVQTTFEVPLVAGRNKVEVEVSDRAGRTSYRPFRIQHYDSSERGKLFFLGFGVSSYRDARLNLAYAHKDVLDLADYFRGASGYSDVIVKTFVNEGVTRDVFAQASDVLKSAEPRDTVIVFVAGHGTHAGKGGADYYYLTHDADVERLEKTAAPFASLENLFADLRARRRLLLLDTCESGEREPGEVQARTSEGKARGLSSRGLTLTAEKKQSDTRTRPFTRDRDRFITSDLVRRTGTIVLSSSQGAEFSYENAKIENGVFTEQLLVALTSTGADGNKDGSVDTHELRKFLAKSVSEATGGLQNPVVDRDNLEQTVALPVMPSLAALTTRPLSALPGAAGQQKEPGTSGEHNTAAMKVPPTNGCACRAVGGQTDGALLWLLPLLGWATWRRRQGNAE